MTQPICPHVGAVDADNNRSDAAAYPSFENRCFVVHLIDPADDGLASGEQLLQRDQATYCLGEGHRFCPRFRLTQARAGIPPTVDSTLPLTAAGELDNDFAFVEEGRGPARIGMWAGLATMLLVFLLCGGSLAAYAGWRMVGQGLVTLSQRVESQPQTDEQGAVLILVTATGQPSTPPQADAQVDAQANAPANAPAVIVTPPPAFTPTFVFPAAVTATPASAAPVGPVVITTPTPKGQIEDPLAPELATAVAGAVAITQPGDTPPTPTRRPTPDFVVPTSTPGTPVVGGVSATVTPVNVEPSVTFRAAHQSVLPGDCTTISWDVENVRAVFLDGEGVWGRGERRVCLRWTSQAYTLVVLRVDGTEETHTVIVELVPHTVTPTITPTSTPVLTPTPTWTPVGTPSATPIPSSFGVQVTVDGGNQKQCSVGARCQVNLLVENIGSLADEMFLNLTKTGPWSAQICRDDGNCGDTALSIGVGARNQRTLLLMVDVPGDGAGQSFTFFIEAASGNSGRTISSGQVSVTVHGQ